MKLEHAVDLQLSFERFDSGDSGMDKFTLVCSAVNVKGGASLADALRMCSE